MNSNKLIKPKGKVKNSQIFTTWKKYKWFYIGGILILAAAVLSRFLYLGARPLHHDEGMLSYFAWQLASSGNYVYTPQIHAPILFYVQAILFKIFGTGDNIARLGPAIFGIALISVPLIFKKMFGSYRAIAISMLILTSPILLYYSRFLVHTSLVILFWFLFVLTLRWFFKKPNATALMLSVVFFVLGFAVSETSYIFAAVIVTYIPILYLLAPKKFVGAYQRIKNYFKENPYDLLSAFILFVLVWAAAFSTFFTNVQSLLVSLPNPFSHTTALGFWMSQHKSHLGNQPWYYYFILLAVYEPLLIVAGIFAIIDSFRKKSPFYYFLVWWTLAMLAGISIAGEKFPWLILSGLLPLTVLAGYYFGTNWVKFKLISKIIWVLILAFTVFNAYRLCFIHPADTSEIAVYVQTPDNYREIISKINAKCPKKDFSCVSIDSGISWPNSWIFHDNGSLYSPDGFKPSESNQFIILEMDKTDATKIPETYSRSQIQLREWWVPAVCRKLSCANNFYNYFVNRDIWNEKGGFDVYLYEKNSEL